jgi:carboxypeptidase Taq
VTPAFSFEDAVFNPDECHAHALPWAFDYRNPLMASKKHEATAVYQEVCEHAKQAALLASILEFLGWDEQTHLPPAAGDYRAEQSTWVAGQLHRQWTDKKFGDQLDELAAKLDLADVSNDRAASDDMAVTIFRLKRQRDKRVKLPQLLVEELTRATLRGQHVWREARQKNDFPTFRPLLERIVELKRQQAEALGYPQCPYDALLDEYEPDALTSEVAGVLEGLRKSLVPLVAKIQQSARQPNLSILHRSFPADAQEKLGREVAVAMGLDFARSTLDETLHPFCCTLGPNDCRITTNFDPEFFNSAFFSVMHESGHAIYEQGLPTEQFGLPLGAAVSLGIHESQSRLWENLVGRSRAFWKFFYPKAQQLFPSALANVPMDAFLFAVNDVRPSLVRIEADEVTYNLHILIRFELERALLDGDLQAADLPAAWNDRYKQYLGITPPTDREGVLQDVHWSSGLIGYFPTYALGNLYAAQFFAKANDDAGDLPGSFAQGNFKPLFDWLHEHVHRHGQRYSAAELVRRATGRPLSPEPLIEHLTAKAADLYGV